MAGAWGGPSAILPSRGASPGPGAINYICTSQLKRIATDVNPAFEFPQWLHAPQFLMLCHQMAAA